MAYTGRLHPKRGTFFRLQVYERVWISLVEAYKRVGKSVFPSLKRPKKVNTRIYGDRSPSNDGLLMAMKKKSWFSDFFMF